MSGKNYNFQKLTPNNSIKLKIYENALNFIFENDDIKNVAISGAYGAGKSSVIETYQGLHPNIHFLHISLAHFEPIESNDTDSLEVNKSALEGKILNQLIHQINPDEIPQTYFKVKQTVTFCKNIRNTAIGTLFLICALYTIFFRYWSTFVSSLTLEWLKVFLEFTTNSALLLLSGLFCVTIVAATVYSVIRKQKYKNIFKKVNVQGNEFEIFEENDDSFFDKYLNEVLYLFENSKSNVIVFEDMDRYDVNQIFEKLREINTLINNKRVSQSKAPIRFFYLIKDNIFSSKDRTKFFDFIIPIVPVIDGSNSYDQLLDHFEKGSILELFDKSFLKGLSLYIDDMRILKNIYNEFVIYYDRIQSTDLDNNKLLAMIVYKNIFPCDFNDLQLGMGFVYTLFMSKNEFGKPELQNIELKIQKIKDEIKNIDGELLNSIDELNSIYLLSNIQVTSVPNINIAACKTRLELVKAMKDNPVSVQYYNVNYGHRQIDMTPEFANLLQNPEYAKRKKIIENKVSGKIEKLKSDIQILQKQKIVIQNNRLSDIINKDNIKAIFSVNYKNEIDKEEHFDSIKGNPYILLIKYLLRNGYIDETYPDYMTYFYENSLSRLDKIFLRSVTDQVPKEYTYTINNPQLVMSSLRIIDFDREEILNIDLLSYLLISKTLNNDYLLRFINQLIETKNYKFVSEFLATGKKTNQFIEIINHLWTSVFEGILLESDFSDEQKKQYAINTLYYSTDTDVINLNQNDCLSKFISDRHDFLDIDSPDIEKLIRGFSLINVKFTSIDYGLSNKMFFNAVYISNLYQITFNSISIILKSIYGFIESDDLNSKNYSLIISKPDEELVKYVGNNMNLYLGIILENCNGYINDEESAVIEILNNSEINIENKKKYIGFLITVLEHIENITNKEMWSLLLKEKLVIYSEDNILNYYFHSGNGFDTYLVEFINSCNQNLNIISNSINGDFGDNAASKFLSSTVTSNLLNNQKYEMILRSLGIYYSDFIFKDVVDEKVLILININFIEMTNTNLMFMRDNYPNQLLAFIVKNIIEYTKETLNETNFILTELLSILENADIPDKYKIKLLKLTMEKLSVKEKIYSDKVKLHILENNLNLADIPFLLGCFKGERKNIKMAIMKISIKHVNEIISEQYIIPFGLLVELFESTQFESQTMQVLFAQSLPEMNVEETKIILQILKLEDYLGLFDKKRPLILNNNVNQKILAVFKKNNWIKSFDIDKNAPSYYRAIGRKIKKS